MKASELSFRDVYHKICFISAGKDFKALAEHMPNHESANGTLAYGYIDHEAGLTYEVLACAFMDKNGHITPYDGNNSVSMKFRSGSVNDCEIYILKDDNVLTSQYKEKIDMVNEGYKCKEAVSATREIRALDESRSPEFPDDVLVYLFHGENMPEGCWVRCEGLKDNRIIGKLLNEPNQNFTMHIGDMIPFGITEQENQYICVSML